MAGNNTLQFWICELVKRLSSSRVQPLPPENLLSAAVRVASSCKRLMPAGLIVLAGEPERARGLGKCTDPPPSSHLPSGKVMFLLGR